MGTSQKIYTLLLITILVLLLIYARAILLPLILAVIFWFVIRQVRGLLYKSPFVAKNCPFWLSTTVASLLLLLVFGGGVQLLNTNIQYLYGQLPRYQANLVQIEGILNRFFDIDITSMLTDQMKGFNFASLLSTVLSTLSSLLGKMFTVLLYLIFILIEETVFPRKLKALYTRSEPYNKMRGILTKIDHSVSNYVSFKTLTSLLTGLLSYTALWVIGVDAPVFWAFLIFILNFIPTIGSLIATLFPTVFALLQFGMPMPAVWVLLSVGLIQLIIGNFIEPKLLGSTLNLSSLTVLLSLAVWGMLWGVTGMIISVPVTVIMVIIMSEFPSGRPVAILLSDKGELNEGRNEGLKE